MLINNMTSGSKTQIKFMLRGEPILKILKVNLMSHTKLLLALEEVKKTKLQISSLLLRKVEFYPEEQLLRPPLVPEMSKKLKVTHLRLWQW